MIGNLVVEIEATEPAIGEVEVDFFAQFPLRTDTIAVSNNEHSDHELGIDRRSTDLAVEGVSVEMHNATLSTSAPHAVDNTDWLKTAAIILVTVDHIDHFFIEEDRWWSVFGRLAAPTFFFLMGYAQTRTVPLHWIWLGVILTLLDSWNDDWTWVAPNILLSLALIRIARPYVQILMQHHGWAAFAFLVFVLFALLPIAEKIVEYGAEGWLCAMFGLCQRMYVDEDRDRRGGGGPKFSPARAGDNRESGSNAPAGLAPRSSTSGRNKGNTRLLKSISPPSFSASSFCPLACVCSDAARAASNRQNPWPAFCASSAGTLWKFTPSSLPARNSL